MKSAATRLRFMAATVKRLCPRATTPITNYIHHTGVFFKQGVGVDVTGVGNRVSHNLIHDCPRFAISWSVTITSRVEPSPAFVP
jgi:hypothetical protein